MVSGGITYIITNQRHTVLYVGVTNDIHARIYQHKTKEDPKSFAAKYNCHKLVYYEIYFFVEEAIDREKQIKRYSRKKKEALINSMNPDWKDLLNTLD